jgi:hypothetical protein
MYLKSCPSGLGMAVLTSAETTPRAFRRVMTSEPLFQIIDPREELAFFFFFRAWLRSRSSDLVRLKIAEPVHLEREY